ncbi:MAG TPA: AarF/UbiB family protein [Streptosporangiaceae bacterium]
MSDLPYRAVTRTAKLATLPVGIAGRAALGLGKRLGGRPAEIVAQEIQQRTAEQIFRVLGELKGGALKLGQALSIFEAALPPEIAEPYRATLTRLQESAPPLPSATVHKVLAADLGENWRDSFLAFDDVPAAAASIGQVHRATWRDGRPVAVKIQYPGAGKALSNDFTQLSRIGRLFGALMPGLEIRPLLDELRDRVVEELDYHLEAASQQAFATAYADDPDIFVPQVVCATDHVLISEWMDGVPLAEIIASGTKDQRNRAGLLLVRFLFSGPARCGLLHADPHPGNFRLLPDGRLGVLDFGAVDRLPDGLPPIFGRLMWLIHHDGDIEQVEHDLRSNGFLRPGIHVDLAELQAFLAPLAEPSEGETFTFSREWMRDEAVRVADIRPANAARRLNLPPSYVLIHRVTTAGIGVLCQLGCEGRFRAEVLQWIPGYGPSDGPGQPAGRESVAAGAEAPSLAAPEPATVRVASAPAEPAGVTAANVEAAQPQAAAERTAAKVPAMQPNGAKPKTPDSAAAQASFSEPQPARQKKSRAKTASQKTTRQKTTRQEATGAQATAKPATEARAAGNSAAEATTNGAAKALETTRPKARARQTTKRATSKRPAGPTGGAPATSANGNGATNGLAATIAAPERTSADTVAANQGQPD